MDRILKRQLRKLGLSGDKFPDADSWPRLLETLTESYQNSEKERRLLEHSIQVNSDEMHHLHQRLKDKVARRSNQLNVSERKQNTVLETLADGVVIISNKGLIEGFNRASEQIFGYTKEEIIGQNVAVLMPKEDQKNHDSYVQKTVVRGSSKIFHRSRELLGLTKDGKQFPLELNVAPLDSEIGGFVGILRDVSDRRAHENELIDAKEAAESSSRAKSQFLASMSHELRTPLNAILGFAELFEYAPNISDKYKKNAEEIHTAGSHLLTLINEILNMSRIESGNIELSTEVIYLKDLLNECFSLSKNLADKKNIKMHFADEKIYTLQADYTRLKQVFLNLLSNAIKYNKEHGDIICSCEVSSKGFLKIKVEDTGIGIDNLLLPMLFEPFNRLGAENGAIEGTGLGLTITKKLVEVMGGNIGVASTVGVGSSFWFELPGELIQQQSPLTKEVEKNIDELNYTLTAENKPVILYIEDNPASQRLINEIAELNECYKVVISDNAEDGIKVAEKIQPSIILLDIDLPGMNGYEAFLRLKGNSRLKNIPVIGTSVNANDRDVKKAINMGFEDFLKKPIQVTLLQTTIENILVQISASDVNLYVDRR